MLRHRLVRLAVLIDDEMNLGMLHAQQAQPNVRSQPHTGRMRQEARDLQPYIDLVDGYIGSLIRGFGPMNHEPIDLDCKMPEAEAHLSQLHLPAGRIFKYFDDLAA